MMRKRLQLLLVIVLVLSIVPFSFSIAQAASYTALRRMLERVPDTANIRNEPLSYLDLAALIDARIGAAHPHSIAEWNALDQEAEASGLYFATLLGVSAGVPEILQTLRRPDEMLAATGVDIFSIDRMLTGGRPPSMLNVLQGKFDAKAIQTTYTSHDYQATTKSDFTVLCPVEGCDKGIEINLVKSNPANPFGGRFGRTELLAVTNEYILNTPDESVLDSALAVQTSLKDSLSANADYLGAVNTAGSVGTVLQAYFVPAASVSDYSLYILPRLTAEQQQQLEDALRQNLKPIPQYSLVLIAHVAREKDQAVIVSLVYNNEADAKIAAQELPDRLNSYQSFRVNQPFAKLITDVGATIESTDVVEDTESGKFVVIMKIAAPYEGDKKIGERYVASGLLFSLFTNAIFARDTGWLITQVP